LFERWAFWGVNGCGLGGAATHPLGNRRLEVVIPWSLFRRSVVAACAQTARFSERTRKRDRSSPRRDCRP
jgi:hypothetical protein